MEWVLKLESSPILFLCPHIWTREQGSAKNDTSATEHFVSKGKAFQHAKSMLPDLF